MSQPDIHDPNPYSTQSYNRYSYAMNNPLKYVDPSGYTSRMAAHNNWMRALEMRAHREFHESSAQEERERSICFMNFHRWATKTQARFTFISVLGVLKAEKTQFAKEQDLLDNREKEAAEIPNGGAIDWNTASSGAKIIHIAKALRNANLNSESSIDMRIIFDNFPQYHIGQLTIGANISFGDKVVPVTMSFGIYPNMKIGAGYTGFHQKGPFQGKRVDGVEKNGYWNSWEYTRAGGTLYQFEIMAGNNWKILDRYIDGY